jgi:TATA-box binding protein (TBP) (component of TFIID and TFIIIB)
MESLRVSTMTQIAHISTSINLKSLYDTIQISPVITYVSLGTDSKGVSTKKHSPKKRYFFNQMTIHLMLDKIINMKLFNNGGIQMTGLKTHTQGRQAILRFIHQSSTYPLDILSTIFPSTTTPEITDMKMVMINSDFDIGYAIDREALHRAIIQGGLYSSFDTSIYPGVNIKYYYHPDKDENPCRDESWTPGVCQCDGMCTGKGTHGFCKKITIAAFKSGKIIITGGQSDNHIKTAYEFITKFIQDRRDQIKIIDTTIE